MTLPSWAAPPAKTYEHHDNYSELEVVWTDARTGAVQIQTAEGYIRLADQMFGDGGAGPALHKYATRLELYYFSAGAAVLGAVGGMLGAHVWHP